MERVVLIEFDSVERAKAAYEVPPTRLLTTCSATVPTATSGSSKPPNSRIDRRIVCIVWRSRAVSAADETRDHEMHFSGTFVRNTRSGI
ncbi:hypothetical protein ACQ5SK_18695 [Bradyrhizobium japonicum]